MEEERYKIKQAIKVRIRILHVCFTLGVVFFLGWVIFAIYCSGSVKRGFVAIRDNYIIDSTFVEAQRGSIYARNGEPLAKSIKRKALYIDFGSEKFDNYEKYCKDADSLSKALAAYFGDKSAREYYSILTSYREKAIKTKTVYDTIKPAKWKFWGKVKYKKRQKVTYRKHITRQIFRDVDLNEWEYLRKLPLLQNGLGVTYKTEDRHIRVYPQGDIALRTIGRIDKEKLFGVEYAMREELAGHNGVQMTQVIAPGFSTRINHKKNIKAEDGYDVVTTLDVDVQDVVDAALRKQILDQNAMWGTAIVMECETGDILAMSNLKNAGEKCVEVQNYAIGIPVNPGSTFKLVSAMALLENGVPASQKYNSGLGQTIAVGNGKGANVTDSHPIGEDTGGVIDMYKAFTESANVYFTTAVFEAFKDNPDKYAQFCRDLFLNQRVGLKEFGATYKSIDTLSRKHGSRFNALVNMAYGYGIEITPLHTITLYNAIANGGKMVAPRLILRTEHNGKVEKKFPVKVLRDKVCSSETVKTLRTFMEGVSQEGTGAKFFGSKVCSFTSGSKTGTSQVDTEINKVRYFRYMGYYYGSMVTYLPADNPRYTVMTAILTKRQSGKAYYGADLAGPVQKAVATFLYNRDQEHAKRLNSKPTFKAEEIKSGNIEKINEVADSYGGDVKSDANKGWGKYNNDESSRPSVTAYEIDETRVPDVVGMGLNDALYLLENCGLKVEVVGHGKVKKQSLSAGSLVSATSKRIKIELK